MCILINQITQLINTIYISYYNPNKDVKLDTQIDFDLKNSDKDPKFKVGDHVKISKYKNIFPKGCSPDQFDFYEVKNLKTLYHGHTCDRRL